MNAYGTTTVGRRNNNEDAFCVADEIGLYAVADGMGGYEGGEVASRIVVDTLMESFAAASVSDVETARLRLELAIQRAHSRVTREAEGRLSEMGSTVAALLRIRDRIVVAHVGDSRVYRLREGRIEYGRALPTHASSNSGFFRLWMCTHSPASGASTVALKTAWW